jgi:hypothetical protein
MTKSLGPPGGYGAITLIGLVGQLWAIAAPPTKNKDATSTEPVWRNFKEFSMHLSK